MTVIAKCQYNTKGQLLKPLQSEINQAAQRALNEELFEDTNKATFTRGFYHRYVIEVTAQNYREAKVKLEAKRERFIDAGSRHGTYRAIRRTPSSGRVLGNKTQMSYTLIYAIE